MQTVEEYGMQINETEHRQVCILYDQIIQLSPAGFNMLIEWLKEDTDGYIKTYTEKVKQWENFKLKFK